MIQFAVHTETGVPIKHISPQVTCACDVGCSRPQQCSAETESGSARGNTGVKVQRARTKSEKESNNPETQTSLGDVTTGEQDAQTITPTVGLRTFY